MLLTGISSLATYATYVRNVLLTFASFCLGGHKFAGNLVVYPQGDWYGNLDSRSTEFPRVLQDILSRRDPLESEVSL